MQCPICGKQFDSTESLALPFCGERCRTIDLGRWLGEGYSLPAIRDPDEMGEAELPDDEESRAGHSSDRSL